jgi:hypothetical protein
VGAARGIMAGWAGREEGIAGKRGSDTVQVDRVGTPTRIRHLPLGVVVERGMHAHPQLELMSQHQLHRTVSDIT